MVIIDLPLDGGGAVRAGLIGSCRVLTPFGMLGGRSSAKSRFAAMGVCTYTAAEAIQELGYSRRLLNIPDRFAPLVLNRASTDDLPNRLARLIDSCDVFLVEISTLDYLACGDFCFNYQTIASKFVRRAGPEVMAWFRQLSTTPSPPTVVAAALASMRDSGKVPDAATEEILTSLIRVQTTPEDLEEQVARIIFARDRRWIFQPLFDLPVRPEGRGDPKRSALRDQVARAAAAAGAEYFDLTALVARVGRENALKGDGVDPCHYALDFLPTVRDALRDVLTGVSAS
jgi:hypothetical protein